MQRSLLFLCLSAFLCAFSFVFSANLWWCILLYPLFFLISTDTCITFRQGFLWALLTYSIQIIGIIYTLFTMHCSYFLLTFIFLYTAFVASIPYFFMEKIIIHLKHYFNLKQSYNVFFNAVSLCISQLLVTDCILLPAGKLEGYIFANPFILLASKGFYFLLSYYNIYFLTFLFYSNFPIIIFFLKNPSLKSILSTLLITFIIILPVFTEKEKNTPPAWVETLAVFPTLFKNPYNISELISYINKKIDILLHNHPTITHIFLPEGAIDCAVNREDMQHILKHQTAISRMNILFGSSCWHNSHLHNSCFIAKKGSIIEVYHKRHVMPLTERPIFPFTHHTRTKIISASENTHPLIQGENFSFVPYICSELFFNRSADDEHKDPIVALCSDIWFFGIAGYIKKLMIKTVEYKAILWQRPIIYVSYSDSYYVEKNGKKISLLVIH